MEKRFSVKSDVPLESNANASCAARSEDGRWRDMTPLPAPMPRRVQDCGQRTQFIPRQNISTDA